ncbi:MAG TPA: acyltransferase [Candidatus Acidoferrum sp.]|nr:acyltransferase [Candidatus Acidoferrum sp.]
MSERDFFVHPNALVASERIGKGTRIWAFANVQKEAIIGADVNICDHCFVENHVVIGDRVTVKNGVSLWDGMTIEDDVFIGPNAVFTNDIYPRSKVYHESVDRTLLKQGCTIGANAVVVAGHTIGKWAMIGAGAVVTKNVPDFTLWFGNPAVFVACICRCANRLEFVRSFDSTASTARCSCGLAYRLVGGSVIPIG